METAASAPEQWRPVPGLPGYEASSLGRIRSLDRERPAGGALRRYAGRVLRPRPKPGSGYFSVYSDGGRYATVNRAVAAAFHGPAPSDEHEAAHLDGNPANNRPSNLAWKTPAENEADKRLHGTAPIGSKNGRAKLHEADILTILLRYAGGDTAPELALAFGVSPRAILNVVAGKSWGHVECRYRAAAAARAQVNVETALRLGREARAGSTPRR